MHTTDDRKTTNNYDYDLLTNSHTVTFYVSCITVEEILRVILKILQANNEYSSRRLNASLTYVTTGKELLSFYIERVTISAGLPRNDYGQVVEILFNGKRKHNSSFDTLHINA